MNSKSCLFIFFVILLLEAERSSGFTIINSFIFDFNESINDSLGESLEHAYSRDILAFGSRTPLSISMIKPHLRALKKAATDQPKCKYYEYLLELCNNHTKLQQLDDITDNIHDFVAESEGKSTSIGNDSIIISGNFFSGNGNQKRFVATSVQTDNDGKIKERIIQHELELEKAELERQKAVEERQKALAKAAREREAAAAERARVREERLKVAEKERKESQRAAAAERARAVTRRTKSLAKAAREREERLTEAAKEREKRLAKAAEQRAQAAREREEQLREAARERERNARQKLKENGKSGEQKLRNKGRSN